MQPDRLCEAAARYIDWEAFAYWARPALERESRLPAEVASNLNLDALGSETQTSKRGNEIPEVIHKHWQRLMLWIADHCFQDAQTEGWFDAILVHVRSHPRAIRTMEYADHCDELWSSESPTPYPSLRTGAGTPILTLTWATERS